ncbi:TetR/AcrR family transcriptional regulator [Thermoactinospora rubra]|uniref:TetR/AcrR family transcriptional regulator n=1 Tax=Thermoactinospora rubra TaxID=1088767 RepID=UPI000A116D26|nr:TetR/AcrR family transcriptional regulator [Thermoactinospora rubra]
MSEERVVEAATALFAEHGYAGTSIRMIAAATGLSVATVDYHARGKASLYRRCLARLAEQERDVAAALLADLDSRPLRSRADALAFLGHAAEVLVRMTRDRPHVPRLWVRQWLDGPADLDPEYTLSPYRAFGKVLDRLADAGYAAENRELLLSSVTWLLYGYFLAGPLDWRLGHDDPARPEHVAAFTALLTAHLAGALGISHD